MLLQYYYTVERAVDASQMPYLQVSKAVYASTAKSQLNLNNKRANDATPTLTYPDISFAVENYEEAFESLVCLFYSMWLVINFHIQVLARATDCATPSA